MNIGVAATTRWWLRPFPSFAARLGSFRDVETHQRNQHRPRYLDPINISRPSLPPSGSVRLTVVEAPKNDRTTLIKHHAETDRRS